MNSKLVVVVVEPSLIECTLLILQRILRVPKELTILAVFEAFPWFFRNEIFKRRTWNSLAD